MTRWPQTSYLRTPKATGRASSNLGEVPKLQRETRQVSDRPSTTPLIKADHNDPERVNWQEGCTHNQKNRTHHQSPDLVRITLPEPSVSEAVLNSRRRRAERATSGKVLITDEYRRNEREKLWSSQEP